MKTVSLQEVCEITMGQAPPGDSYNDGRSGLPLVAGAGDFGEAVPVVKKYTTAPSKVSKPNDIILGIRASIGERVWSDREYCLGRGVAGLRPTDKLDCHYLWHWLGSASKLLASKGRGATFLQVNRADIGDLQLPLPPLAEQRRIAAILDHADALRAKRRQVITNLDQLAQAIFHDMFGDDLVGENPPLGALAAVASGITKGRKTSDPTSPVPYLAVSNVQAGHLSMDVVKQIAATEDEVKRYALFDGDLLLTEGGDPDKLGRGTIWRNELPLCIHQNHIFRIRINNDANLVPEYLSAYIASRPGRTYFLRAAKQTTGIASINMTQLKALPVYVAPTPRQIAYVDAIRCLRVQRQLAEDVERSEDALFAALQSRAFSGAL